VVGDVGEFARISDATMLLVYQGFLVLRCCASLVFRETKVTLLSHFRRLGEPKLASKSPKSVSERRQFFALKGFSLISEISNARQPLGLARQSIEGFRSLHLNFSDY